MVPSPTLVTRAKNIRARSTWFRVASRSPSRSSAPTWPSRARTGPPSREAARPLVLTKASSTCGANEDAIVSADATVEPVAA